MNDNRELLGVLEPGQMRGAAQTRLPRRELGRGSLLLMAALRVYVLVAIPIVGYAFVHALTLGR